MASTEISSFGIKLSPQIWGVVDPAQGKGWLRYYAPNPGWRLYLKERPDWREGLLEELEEDSEPPRSETSSTPPQQTRRRFQLIKPTQEITFEASPWVKTGIQPFTWGLVPATGQTPPIIRIAASREVKIDGYRGGNPNPTQPLEIYNEKYPYVEEYRLQNESLLPRPDEPVIPGRLVREPYPWLPGKEPLIDYEKFRPTLLQVSQDVYYVIQPTIDPTKSAIIHCQPNGVVVHGRYTPHQWKLEIRAPPFQPAAFAYELLPHRDLQFGFHMHIVRTGNVKIRVDTSWPHKKEGFPHDIPGVSWTGTAWDPDDWNCRSCSVEGIEAYMESPLNIEEAIVSSIEDVPNQGAYLDPNRFDFRCLPLASFDHTLPRKQNLSRIFFVESAIGIVPVIGELYDLGQLVYALVTGRDYWGQPVNAFDIAVLGVIALLPLGLDAGLRRSLRSVISRKRPEFSRLMAPDLAKIFRRIADSDLIDATENMSKNQQKMIGKVMRRYLDGNVGPAEVVRVFQHSVGERFLRTLDQARLLKFLSDDFSGFRHPALAEGYAKYLSELEEGYKKYTLKKTSEMRQPLNAVEWAKHQSGRSRYRAYLRAVLGEDYVKVINRAFASKKIPVLTREALTVYDKLARRIDKYIRVVEARRKLGNFGHLFEADHFLEKRFVAIRSVDEAIIDVDEMDAILVPKDPAVARQLREKGRTYLYVHSVKTEMMRRLIPHGKEDAFSVQKIWDAHVFTYKRLGIDGSVYLPELREACEEMADLRGERVVFRTDQTDAMFSPGVWVPDRNPSTGQIVE